MYPSLAIQEAMRLCAAVATFDVTFVELGREVAPLDQHYIPTRDPNGLPGGVSFEAYNIEDGQRALRLVDRTLDAVRERLFKEGIGEA